MSRIETIAEGITLYLGDCRDILPTIGTINTIVTDPPYGMAYQSARRSDRHEKIEGDGGFELLQFIANFPVVHSKYIFARWQCLREVQQPKSAITWVKNNWTSGDLDHAHACQTELILFYPGVNHAWPGKRPTDVIECPKVSSDDHPTEKPRQLMERVIEWTAGIVVDPFMGSGATGAAAAKLGRPFIGVEIAEKYFDLSCQRISAAVAAPDMFVERLKPIAQEAML